MKLTKWEVERILEALDESIDSLKQAGRGTKNFERLRDKVSFYGLRTGKLRAKS